MSPVPINDGDAGTAGLEKSFSEFDAFFRHSQHTNFLPTETFSLNPERPAYVPPHLRNRPAGPPAPASAPVAHYPTPADAQVYHPQTGLPTPAPTPPGKGSYVPPSARGLPAPAAALAADDGGWGAPRRPAPEARSFGGGGGSAPPGYGLWKNGHVVGQRNTRMEKELYGEVGDGTQQVSDSTIPQLSS
jgi:ATP-dependent RNA helicase DDX3X